MTKQNDVEADEATTSGRGGGRRVGVLLLLQFAAGLTLPFILLGPGVVGSSVFLTAAAEHAVQVRAAVSIAFLGAVLTVGVGLASLPALRRHSRTAALGLLVACTISAALDAVHNASVMSMLSLSQRYVDAGPGESGTYLGLAAVVASARRWAHYTQLVAVGAWIFVFYASMWRFRLIPHALAAFGLVGIALQFTGVTLPAFWGYTQEPRLAMPLAPIHLLVAGWLIARGFADVEASRP
jgi:hypothetical protein